MGAVSGSQYSPGRYRRRIVGWGAAALVLTLVVGSATTLARVEDDLSGRVAAAYVDAGIEGVTVSFSGQDGSVACASALDDPDGAIALGNSVRGVRSIELHPGCRAVDRPEPAPPSTATSAPPPPTASTSTTSTTTTTTTTLPDPVTVLDILVDDPQFSVLENAVESVGIDALLGSTDPITLFAPTDEAFSALGPNFNAALASDPDALTAVLRHHIAAGTLDSEALMDGPLVMIDGQTLTVVGGDELRVTSGDRTATVVDADLTATDGVVHVVDQVLIPEGLDVVGIADEFTAVARYEAGTLTLSGTVATDDQLARLRAGAQAMLAAENVIDEVSVDPDAPIGEADIDALVALITVLPANVVVGEVVVGIDGLFVSGVHVDAAALATIEAVAEDVGAVTGLNERPVATEAGLVELEARLNAIVAADPIRFEPASADLSPAGAGTLDRVAAEAKSVGGALITIEGHTDSDGSPVVNVALSRRRADAVLAALVSRGVPAESLVATGFGSAEPVLVEGVEDKAASRRVEFRIESG